MLTSSYQQLRGFSHKATLQNEGLLIDNSVFNVKDKITSLWKKFLVG
jgi:hypothetical protein